MDAKNNLRLIAKTMGLRSAADSYTDRFVSKFIEDAISIEEEDAKRAGVIGYTAKALVQTTIPHSDPKTNEFIRVNGHYTLTMMAPSAIGLPYGSIPRVILTWITTEAKKTESRRIYLGENLARFLHKIGLSSTGGKRGDITRVKTQMKKLIQTHITCTYRDQSKETITNLQTISQAQSWWATLGSDQNVWQTELVLNHDFFKEIITSPIPINLNAIQALKNSSLAIDIYCWLTYRMFTLKKDLLIPWDKLFLQFGTGYADTSSGHYAFKKKFIGQLKKVSLIYSQAALSVVDNGLYLKPSPPHILPIAK